MILSFLKQYRLPIGIALLLMLVELTVELLNPFFLAKIIDEGIMQGDLSVIYKWGAVLVSMSFVSFLVGVINAFYSAHVSHSTGFDIRNRLYEKVQSFSFADLQNFSTPSLITRMTNDVTQIQTTIYLGLGIMARAPLRVLGGTAMAFIIHSKLALILVVTIPILIVFLIWMLRKGSKLFSQVQTKLDGVNHVLRENLMAIRLVKIYVRWRYEGKRFNKKSSELKDRTVKALRVMELTTPILLLLMNTAIIGILWFGSIEFHAGGAQVGEVVAIVNYTLRITSALTVFSVMITIFSRAKASATRIEEVLATETSNQDPSTTKATITNGTIKYNQVSFHYPGSPRLIVEDCSFTVKSEQSLAILGATGSGKSTLLQLLPRLYDVSSGSMEIDGTDIRDMNLTHLRNQIGYIPQEVTLFTGTVRENINWGKNDATMADMIVATKDAQIHETIMKLPQKYETKIGQKGVNLSGGQKQRIAIARALIRKPRILLLDDSTSALDVKTEKMLLAALRNYKCTTLLITQKINTAIKADSILLMDKGRIVAKGTHEQLMNDSLLYEQIYQSQYLEGDEINAE